ncbi:DNA polymerase III subunit epsilon [Gardnerella greenwoodii]|uniref:DNA polymerase III epsilon subunit-like 3'-5' exonuclease n=3 Tax=Gardnerella greenwoodii TaxID=2914925 RepID=I4M986_9BIFI|nr:DNA polymerase III epsilon subunit-like 3'-5' exonuclease [Gardnerella greenwoodii 00703Dmash]PMC43120.1 DNA polymerase III subunit epsilon [Gardnerella greenwoodii]
MNRLTNRFVDCPRAKTRHCGNIVTMPTNIKELLDALNAAPFQEENTPLSKSWLLGFDTETTGANIGKDAIASATLVLRNPSLGHDGDAVSTWLINPHQPMNPKASEVNGFTDEYLQEYGGEPVEELELLAQAVSLAQEKNIPLLAYNAPFDVAMLRHDLNRWQLKSLNQRPTCSISTLSANDVLTVDPLVIDRAVSIRPGKRTLTLTSQFYGVEPIGDFHDATADTVAALDLVAPICNAYEQVANMTLSNLMSWQREAYIRWRDSFNKWLESHGREPIRGTWL